LSQAKICNQWLARRVEKDIGRLEIAMNNSGLVGVLNAICDLDQQLSDFVRCFSRKKNEVSHEAAALRELHRKVRKASPFTYFINPQDMFVLKRCRSAHLSLKALANLSDTDQRWHNRLERNDSISAVLPRSIDNTHAAAPNFLKELKLREFRRFLGNDTTSFDFVRCLYGLVKPKRQNVSDLALLVVGDRHAEGISLRWSRRPLGL
jgi:hypothetical protein